AMIDVPPTTTPIELEHIQVEMLLKNLPASASPGSIVPTSDPTRFFFRGTPEEQARFLIDLDVVDRPLPQIRYQLLVIQYEDGTARDFSFDLSNSITGPDSAQAFLGSVGNLLSLNFDVIAAFGYQFAARLNAQIANSAATVLVDTTLNALSGQSARFQSTNTYRYRDSVADPDTGDIVPTGVIREITSGLILRIDGWVSGGDLVTMDVSATLSKRGTDNSDGNPPRTSEKVVDTHIRTASGEPVVLSGLVQQEVQRTITETPLLGRIPLIGLLFQERDETLENTELAIYIIPHVERPATTPREISARLMDLYDRFGRDPK
ncbi:MAG: type II and III secretion system protein, partial [Spirochaetales bacterium]|nr:type II and III secretion system protein [Spirochaetales bacterium]